MGESMGRVSSVLPSAGLGPVSLAIPKSRILTKPAAGDHHVAGFEIAVHNAGGVRGLQRVGHLRGDVEVFCASRPCLGTRSSSVTPLTYSITMNSRPSVRDHVVDGDDVGVVQRGSGLGFLDKAAPALHVAGVGGGQHLHRHEAVETRVLRLVNLTHASGAQFFQHGVMGNRPPDHKGVPAT